MVKNLVFNQPRCFYINFNDCIGNSKLLYADKNTKIEILLQLTTNLSLNKDLVHKTFNALS